MRQTYTLAPPISSAPSLSRSSRGQAIPPEQVVSELEKRILVDGFKLVIDLEKSRGAILVDAVSGRKFIDFYSFYASMPVGFNHPHFDRPDVESDLLAAAKIKVANSDVYSTQFAEFIDTFHRVAGIAPLNRYFFIEGGAAAVENALKAAMDWKVRKNLAAGLGERGAEILHFQSAFHGRSGYTLSLTKTDTVKTDFYARFPWPRAINPCIDYSLSHTDQLRNVIDRERQAAVQIGEFIAQRGTDIAAIIIEPIQGEGGDNHFRAEWFRFLREICDQNEILLIFDEVQTGMGMSGRAWCCQHFDIMPDLLVFGKKTQVCGVMAGPRLDEVRDNVFRLSSRINSTWGGNFCDFVRSTHYLRIIEREELVENARDQGEFFLGELQRLMLKRPAISAPRGRGLLLAFNLPNRELRDRFWAGAYERGLLVLRSGERSIRIRPVLDVTEETIESALRIIDQELSRM